MTETTKTATTTTTTATTAKEIAAKINAFAALAEEKERENTERNEEIVLHFFKY